MSHQAERRSLYAAFPVLLVLKDPGVPKALREAAVRQVGEVLSEYLALLDQLDPQDRPVLPDREESPASASPDPPDLPDLPDPSVP